MKGAAIGSEDVGQVLAEVNDLLNEDNDAAMFVTVLYAVYDPETGVLSYASGGHDPPLIVRSDGSSELAPPTGGVALGVAPGIGYRHNEVHLEPGDTVVLFTDGVTEAMNAENEQFGIERLREVFAGNPPTDSEQANRAVFEAVRDFAGDNPQSDDITCLTLRRSETDS